MFRLNSESGNTDLQKKLTGLVMGTLMLLWLFSLLRLVPILGDYKVLDHLWLSCHTLNEVLSWDKEGAFSLWFAHIMSPLSIESQEIVANPDLTKLPLNAARSAYISWPPGTLLPVWALSKILAFEPSLALARTVNALFWLGIVLMLALTVAAALRTFSPMLRALAAFLAGVFYLYAERTTLVHYSSYFSEISVMLPVVVVLWYEMADRPKRFRVPVALAVFYGGLCEPTIYFLSAVLIGYDFLKRFKEQRDFTSAFKQTLVATWYLSLPLMLALSCFIVQLIHLNALDALASRFAVRTGRGDEQGNPVSVRFYLTYYKSYFLLISALLLLPLLAVIFRNRHQVRIEKAAQLTDKPHVNSRVEHAEVFWLYALTCCIHLVIFWDFNIIHNYLTIKFYVLMSLGFGLIAGLCFNHLKIKTALTYCSCVTIVWFTLQTGQIKDFKQAPNFALTEYGEIIKSQSSFESVFLSAEFKAYDMPPHLLSITGKRVYQLPLRKDIYDHFKTLKGAQFKFVITRNLLTPEIETLMAQHGFRARHFECRTLPDLYMYTFTVDNLDRGMQVLFNNSYVEGR